MFESAELQTGQAQAVEEERLSLSSAQLGRDATDDFSAATEAYRLAAASFARSGHGPSEALALAKAARTSVRATQTYRAFVPEALRDASLAQRYQHQVVETNEAAARVPPNLHQQREFLENAVRAADAIDPSVVSATFRARRETLRENLNDVNALLSSQP